MRLLVTIEFYKLTRKIELFQNIRGDSIRFNLAEKRCKWFFELDSFIKMANVFQESQINQGIQK